MNDTTQRKRAKYLTDSSHTSRQASKLPSHSGFSFCESIHATSHSPWHLRELDSAGKKLGGGITTFSLCGLVQRGWDLEVEITEHHLKHSCKRCVAEYVKLKLK